MQHSISPLDGRYADRLQAQQRYFSEKALMEYRCKVELRYALALDQLGIFQPLDAQEKLRLEDALTHFSDEDYAHIKRIEQKTKHDVKACEIFLREKTGISNEHLFHFALTSEDANNLAYALMLKDHLEQAQLPQCRQLLAKLAQLVEQWKNIPFPARTHGQKASPSTAGKELAVFLHRLLRIYEPLSSFRFSGKLNGAVGNYSAMLAAFPEIDWMAFSDRFLADLGLTANYATTQIEDHDTFAFYFNWVRQWNNVVMDLDVDCWLYISRDLFSEKSNADEVGSSTMPHKVNPINFENSEGNLSLSNALLVALSEKLTKSRMQRDLSDSTVQRNMGVALAHSYLAVSETLRGLEKLQINPHNCLAELEQSPELLAEPIQTILKTVGVADPYDLLKKATRGQKVTQELLMNLVNGLDIPQAVKERIAALSPVSYVGDALRICERVLQHYRALVA